MNINLNHYGNECKVKVGLVVFPSECETSKGTSVSVGVRFHPKDTWYFIANNDGTCFVENSSTQVKMSLSLFNENFNFICSEEKYIQVQGEKLLKKLKETLDKENY